MLHRSAASLERFGCFQVAPRLNTLPGHPVFEHYCFADPAIIRIILNINYISRCLPDSAALSGSEVLDRGRFAPHDSAADAEATPFLTHLADPEWRY